MSATGIILLMAVVTYLPRIIGFTLPAGSVHGFWRRFLHFVPIAVFAALVVPGLPGAEGELGIRIVGAAAAGLAIWRTHSVGLGILVGMAAFWLLRAAL